jgi:predicted RNA-binding Zn ribbon-like protein
MDELADRLPPLIANALCLDFTNTLEPERDRDHLGGSYEGLVRWAEHAGIVTGQAAEPDQAERIFEDAVRLRAAVHAAFSAIAGGGAPDERDLGILRDAYARAVAAARLGPAADRFALSWPDQPALPVHAIAASAMELLTSDSLSRVRQCAGEGCGWLFLDTTRNRSRRWCLMRYCGNAVKSSRQAAVRRAARAAATTPRPIAPLRRRRR